MFIIKWLSALALLMAVVASAHAQAGSAEASRPGASVVDRRDAPAAGKACGAAGQAACAKVPERKEDGARAGVSGEPNGMALAWAALGVVAFLALRRQPRT